jgi:hypothetical protein
MTEIAALAKHNCAACGAQATWNPGKQKLVCTFCGTEAPYRVDQATGQVEELDLVRALRELPDEQRGWQAAKRSVQCQSCKAVSVFDPERVGQNCAFCGSPALVDYQEIKAPIRPQSLLPFRVTESQVRENIRRWFGAQWLAPGALKRRALVDTVRGVYVPYWTFDAHVVCPWRAEAGHYYYTNETYRDANGRTQTRQVQHVRWTPAEGTVDHFFDDEPIPGSHGLHADLVKGIEPFPTGELIAYDTAYLSGFVVEHYQVVLLEAAQRAEQSMNAQVQAMCARQVPGDTHRNLEIFPEYSGRTFKHVLLPVWLLRYDYGRKAYQVLVNGVTGVISGQAPWSAWKVFFLVLAALVVVGVIILSQG